ncbi:MAG: hypothetical protein LBR15_09260 [Methanobrevibacter sp.]|jgi:hypothetical protein|nr:hypothetical protein [Candidatus Methanovirga australis]
MALRKFDRERKNFELIKNYYMKLLLKPVKCAEIGIVRLKNLAIDGTTVKDNSSKNKRYNKIDLLIA